MYHWWDDTERGKKVPGENTCASVTLCATSRPWIDTVSSSVLLSDRPVTKCLSHATNCHSKTLSQHGSERLRNTTINLRYFIHCAKNGTQDLTDMKEACQLLLHNNLRTVYVCRVRGLY